ncbi:MAG: hypothetical protein KAR39_05310 [Thermoplasmata archaeon]|nr:hypothetical protein [Thermoplasmata archaeon]
MVGFDKWIQTLPSRHRDLVKKYKREGLRGSATDEATERIETDLDRQSRHDRIVGKIALLFTEGEEAASNTKCQFVTYDPLVELMQSNADLLIFEPEKEIALVIEVKTNANPISDLKKSREVVESNREYLESIVKSQVIDVKYILVVDSFVRAIDLKRGCTQNAFALGYIEGNEFKLHDGCPTNLERVDLILSRGVQLFMGDSVYVMLNSHHFHILSNTLIEICRGKLREAGKSGEETEVKVFTRGEFRETFQRLASISSVEHGSAYEKCIEGRLKKVIEEGLQSGVIMKTKEKDTYRIYSQATTSLVKILETMERKYIHNYVERTKEKIAEDNARSRYDQKYGHLQEKLDVS